MDIQYLLWLQSIRQSMGGSLDSFFLFLSKLPISNTPIIVMTLIYWCVDNCAGMYLILNYGWGTTINQLIKNSVCLYRPWIRDARVIPVAGAVPDATGYSFPSGHTCSASTLYGGIGYWYRKHKWISIPLFVLVLLIGFSRNYLGVHHPQDVIVGLVEGFGIVLLNFWALNKIEKEGKGALWYLIAGLATPILIIIYASIKTYPMDYIDGVLIVDPMKMTIDCFSGVGNMIGAVSGWYINRRWIKFTSDGSFWRRLIRFAAGLAMVLTLQKLIKPAWQATFGNRFGILLIKISIYFFITCIFPFMDEKIFKKMNMAGFTLIAALAILTYFEVDHISSLKKENAALISAAAPDQETLYQASTIDALMLGNYDGVISVGSMKKKGNIGSFNALDGEMIVLDGKVYQAKSDGTAAEATDDMTIPFCSVTWFDADQTYSDIRDLKTIDAISTWLDEKEDTSFRDPNAFYAARIDGTFDHVEVRSFGAQSKPYQPLAAIQSEQKEFSYDNIDGTIVAIYCPKYTSGINLAG